MWICDFDVQEFSCRNHVRAVLPVQDGRLFVCATGSDSPALYYLDVTTAAPCILY